MKILGIYYPFNTYSNAVELHFYDGHERIRYRLKKMII
jgi:hypothetical protein